MRRRDFISLLGGAAAIWPHAVHAQQPPVIGALFLGRSEGAAAQTAGFHLGLRQAGFEVGKSLRMEYRYADNQADRLLALATELVKTPVALIVVFGGPAPALAAKAATTTIPIVFGSVPDPVRGGLVASINRPGGNVTGVSTLTLELDPKRLELLHELAPARGPLGVLLNPTRPDTQIQSDGIKTAAQSIRRELVLGHASTVAQIDAAFAMFKERSVAGVLIGADPYFTNQIPQLVALSSRYGWPAIQQWREFAEAGGLAGYGPNQTDAYRQAGIFAARILKGEKPADLPVQQVAKFEFVINLRTAKALGLTVPLPLLGRADEVIE